MIHLLDKESAHKIKYFLNYVFCSSLEIPLKCDSTFYLQIMLSFLKMSIKVVTFLLKIGL